MYKGDLKLARYDGGMSHYLPYRLCLWHPDLEPILRSRIPIRHGCSRLMSVDGCVTYGRCVVRIWLPVTRDA